MTGDGYYAEYLRIVQEDVERGLRAKLLLIDVYEKVQDLTPKHRSMLGLANWYRRVTEFLDGLPAARRPDYGRDADDHAGAEHREVERAAECK